MMKTYDTIPGKLNITQEDVVRVVRRIIKVDGLDAAKAAFRQMNEFFSGQEGWAETTEVVYDLIAEVRRREHLEQHAEELARAKAAAPNVYQFLPTAGTHVGQVILENIGPINHH